MDLDACHACHDRLKLSIPTQDQMDRINSIIDILTRKTIDINNNEGDIISELLELLSRDSSASLVKLKSFYGEFGLEPLLSLVHFMRKRNIYGHFIYSAFRYLEIMSIKVDQYTFDEIEEPIVVEMIEYIIDKHQEFSRFVSQSKSNDGYSNFFFYNK